MRRGSYAMSTGSNSSRRLFFRETAAIIGSLPMLLPKVASAESRVDAIPDSMDVESFLSSGSVANPMGVSGQAGKSKPETGVVLRDGSDILRDSRSKQVSAEIVVDGDSGEKEAVFVSFESTWPLATGSVFDIECRDSKGGDIGAFVAVSRDTKGKSLSELPNDFFLERLFDNTGRYSFYGPPTDIKVKKSYMAEDGSNYRTVELKFSNLSQSTQTEIPRIAVLTATIPPGTKNAVMLVGGTSGAKWRKGTNEEQIRNCVSSFRAVLAPKSKGRVRAKKASYEV